MNKKLLAKSLTGFVLFAAFVGVTLLVLNNSDTISNTLIHKHSKSHASTSGLRPKNIEILEKELELIEPAEPIPCIHEKIVELEKHNTPKELYEYPEVDIPHDQTLEYEEEMQKNHKGSWTPIKIKFDYSNLSSVSYTYRNFIQSKLIPASGAFFESALNVQPRSGPIRIHPYYRNALCSRGGADVRIPADHISNGVSGADIIFYITAKNDQNENYLAYASVCPQGGYTDPTKKPTVAYFNMNLKYLSTQMNTDHWYSWIETTIHEMTHSFVFSPNHYPNFIGERNPVQQSGGQYWVVAPSIVQYARSYFNCPSGNGIPLENNGGSGSAGAHWERISLGNEGMTASDMPDAVFSKFTFLLYRASGWYSPNMGKAQELEWGRGDGCNVMAGRCDPSHSDQLCSQQRQTGCSFDYAAFGSCSAGDPFAAGCAYWRGYSNTDCKVMSGFNRVWQQAGGTAGPNSRCWNNSILKNIGYSYNAACFESSCDFNSSTPVAKVKVNGSWYSCTYKGQSISAGRGSINCPDPVEFCGVEDSCPDACTSKGTCRKGVCHCYEGFTGADCSRQV